MSFTSSVVVLLFFKACSCQPQCVKETPDDKEFLINVNQHITVESGNCITISYELTFPENKVTVPYKKIWFDEDSQKNVNVKIVNNVESEAKDTFRTTGLPQGEYKYHLRLEWGCNQTYIFPKSVRITVSAFSHKPIVHVPVMTEGRAVNLRCLAHPVCSGRAKIRWKQTKADGQTKNLKDFFLNDFFTRNGDILRFSPTTDDHNTNITCVAEYIYGVVETTVNITVKFQPKIVSDTNCMVKGKLLVCVCASRGNPLPPVTWPLASFTDFSVSSSSNMQTVNSTITMPAANYHNTTIKCISSNELGQAEIEIPLQNYTQNLMVNRSWDWREKFYAAHPWLTAVSFSLNLLLLSLTIWTYKWHKRTQKKPCEEVNTYASLQKSEVEQEYNVLSTKCR
ncbi:sialic acid-binding Ig-like lectin 10 [Mastacembelus armatus]|uniref:sialic acid-binding Ig-like lectin 10 n=1 Tax=Mastacembelus armatus TaxID=205130 RepID=UPI000E45ACAE|nr:sialic acid-binding Ig-like lectin 10 [Mastacembelus armatus]